MQSLHIQKNGNENMEISKFLTSTYFSQTNK